MKVLIASLGSTLSSQLARDIVSATWYLLVDTGRHGIEAMRGCGQPLRTVMRGAQAHGIGVVMTGSWNGRSRVMVSGGMIHVALAGTRTVGEALTAWLNGQIPDMDAHDTGDGPEQRADDEWSGVIREDRPGIPRFRSPGTPDTFALPGRRHYAVHRN